MSILIRDKCIFSYFIYLQVWWPPNGGVSLWFCSYLLQQTGQFLGEAISTLSRTLIHDRLWAPCIVLSNYLFAKWILSTCSPRCCHSSRSLLGRSKWVERYGENWQGLPHLCQRGIDRPIALDSTSSSWFTLNQFANMCFNTICTLCNCAIICHLCWCYFLCILACSYSVSREIGLLYCEHNARLSFADLVISGIHYHFQLFYQWLTEAFQCCADFSVLHIGPFWPKFLCFRYGNLGYGLSKEQMISFYFSCSYLASFLLRHKMAFQDVCTCVSLNIGVFSTHSSHCTKGEEHGDGLRSLTEAIIVSLFSLEALFH